MNSVVHFEMPYDDRDRMADFYTRAFGWKMEKFGPDMGNYVVAHTAETDENNMVKTPGAINGGFYEKSSDMSPHPSVVISVDDIQAAIKMVEKAGGEVLGEPTTIPEVGLYVSFIDTEWNRVSMLQPMMR